MAGIAAVCCPFPSIEDLYYKTITAWCDEHGKQPGDELTAEEAHSFSSHLAEAFAPYLLHRLLPVYLPDYALEELARTETPGPANRMSETIKGGSSKWAYNDDEPSSQAKGQGLLGSPGQPRRPRRSGGGSSPWPDGSPAEEVPVAEDLGMPPFRTLPHSASSPALALGNPGQSPPGPIASHSSSSPVRDCLLLHIVSPILPGAATMGRHWPHLLESSPDLRVPMPLTPCSNAKAASHRWIRVCR